MGLILGDGQKMLDIVETAAKVCGKAVPPPRYFHGMWAFGLEQQGCYQDAEKIAKEGLAYEKSLGPDAWLDHGMAHALYFQGGGLISLGFRWADLMARLFAGEDRLEDAERFLKERSSTWSKEALHPFLYTHCWWHLSLLHCERGNYDDCLAIFDERLWPEGSEGEQGTDPQVQLNALNLLWRLELRQASIKPRWQRVLEGCKGLTLPKDDKKGSLQHSDLLLDILLIRGLCIDAKQDPKPLEDFLAATQAHAQEMAKGAGADGRGDTFGALARLVAEIFRSDLPDTSETTERRAKAREEVWALQAKWGCLGGSVEQRGILLEAVKGPVLENMMRDSQQHSSRGLHVVSLAETKLLKLGRGHESNVRIADVSISRLHATIRYQKGSFVLEDHNSKFGTLVAMKKPRPLDHGSAISIQVGRTVLSLSLQSEPSGPVNSPVDTDREVPMQQL
eukprot:symbB.v1.2.013679.t1/scaffold971.1/size148033/7